MPRETMYASRGPRTDPLYVHLSTHLNPEPASLTARTNRHRSQRHHRNPWLQHARPPQGIHQNSDVLKQRANSGRRSQRPVPSCAPFRGMRRVVSPIFSPRGARVRRSDESVSGRPLPHHGLSYAPLIRFARPGGQPSSHPQQLPDQESFPVGDCPPPKRMRGPQRPSEDA